MFISEARFRPRYVESEVREQRFERINGALAITKSSIWQMMVRALVRAANSPNLDSSKRWRQRMGRDHQTSMLRADTRVATRLEKITYSDAPAPGTN